MSKQEKLYKQQRFQDGDWSDVKAKDPAKKSVLRVAKITPEQAKMLNQDVKSLGLKWVKCTDAEIKTSQEAATKAKAVLTQRGPEDEEFEEFNPDTAKVPELDAYIEANEIVVEEGANKDAKKKAVKEFIASKEVS